MSKAMPPISHKLIEKLQKEVADLDKWLSGTAAQDDGSTRREDLLELHEKSQSIYKKTQALHQTTLDNPSEFEQLRLDVSKLDYWLATEADPNNPENLQALFTRANSISLRALSLYRAASQVGSEPQDSAGDEPAFLSGE
jgi:hypothetical protein